MNFAGLLVALAGPLAKKVLSALGIGFITYIGVDTAITAALGAAKANFASVTGDILQIIAMAGFFDAFSAIAGGITAAVTMMVFSRLGKLT